MFSLGTLPRKIVKIVVFSGSFILVFSVLPITLSAQGACTPDRAAEGLCGNETDTNFNIIPTGVCEGDPNNPNDPASSQICRTNVDQAPTDITGPNGTLGRVADLLTVVVGIAAVIVIIISGFRYALSNGDANAITAAKNSIIYALVGVVVTILARQIIVFVLSKF
jgi:hypothetical protein